MKKNNLQNDITADFDSSMHELFGEPSSQGHGFLHGLKNNVHPLDTKNLTSRRQQIKY
jgi:hypothetical protein